ncbi:MAG TPA: TldD/PmbA family protein [Candidatus Acidoferrales bacterium]|nr:TldD/PmbA family protein [Candidatus Acidoferrales bacterium]
MNSADREALAKKIIEYSKADQTEVLVGSGDNALTRFTHETSNQNVVVDDTGLSVRAIVDGRTGVAQTNRRDDASLRDVVARAVDMAKLAPKDPNSPELPRGGASAAPPGAYDEATAGASAGLRAQLCDAVFRAAEGSGYWSAGYASTSAGGITIANTSGAVASFDGTDAAISVKMSGADSTGFAEAHANAVGSIDAGAVGAAAAEKVRLSASPRSVEPGEWTVILETAALGELLSYITPHLSAQSYEEGSSFCSDGLDRKYFSENFSLKDDYANPLSPGMPFDYEGQPTMRLPLIENGVVKNIVTDSYYAKRLDRPNTGHALPAPNAFGPYPRHLVLASGTKSFEQLIAETKRGLLITRFWYIRTVDQKKAIVTGMTRDGTFLIENGKIAGGVRNLRFNQSIIEALEACEFADTQSRTGGYSYSLVAPAAKIERFNFTSTTEF